MSDEETHSGDEEEHTETKAKPIKTEGLDEAAKEILESNLEERRKMEQEIRELRQKSEARKKEREQEEKRLTQERAAEDARRKADEEDRKRRKEDEESKKKEERLKKTAEFEKWKNPPKRNFVITKKTDEDEPKEEQSEETAAGDKKSKEQLEAEKRAILGQRIQPLNIDGFDSERLKDKARELHALISRLESEKYDLEKRFKGQQFDMLELAEKARSMNKVGRGGSKRLTNAPDEADKIQERFAGCPARVAMYSEFERQKDKRSYGDRKELFVGPVFGYPAERIKPTKVLKWGDDGLPVYVEMGSEGGDSHGHGGHGEAAAPAGEE